MLQLRVGRQLLDGQIDAAPSQDDFLSTASKLIRRAISTAAISAIAATTTAAAATATTTATASTPLSDGGGASKSRRPRARPSETSREQRRRVE